MTSGAERSTPNDERPGHRLGPAARLQFIASVVRSGLLFAFQWLLARAYGITAFGICNTAQTGFQTAIVLGRTGGDTVVFRSAASGSESFETEPPVKSGLTLSLLGGIVSAIFLSIWGAFLAGRTRQSTTFLAFALAALAVPASTALVPLGAALQLQKRFSAYSLVVTVLDPVVRVTALGAAVLIGAHWVAAMSSVVIGAVVAVTVAALLLRPALSRSRLTLAAGVVSSGLLWFGGLTAVAAGLQSAMEFAALNVMMLVGGAPDVGLLAAAGRLVMLALWIQISMATGFLPQVPRLTHDPSRRDELRALYHRVIASVLWANGPLLVAMTIGSKALLNLFGASFERGATVLAILAAGQWVNSATALAEDFLPLSGRSRLALVNNLGALLLTIVAGYGLGRAYGVVGVAAALSGATILLNVMRSYQLWRLFRITIPLGTALRWAGACAIALGLIVPLSAGAKTTMPVQLALACSGALLAAGLNYLFSSAEDRRALEMLLTGSD